MHQFVDGAGKTNKHNPDSDWFYSGATPIVNTADVALKAATAGQRFFLTDIQIRNSNATATEVVIKDGATVVWRGHVGASMTSSDVYQFSTPIRTTVGNALNIACITTAASVYVNAQGYISA